MKYMHVYELVVTLEGGTFHAMELKHTQKEIIHESPTTYCIGEGDLWEKVTKQDLNKLVRGTVVYMLTPDNELVKKLFTEWLNELIQDRKKDIEAFGEAKKLVAGFKEE